MTHMSAGLRTLVGATGDVTATGYLAAMATEWSWEPGSLTTRAEVAREFGGAIYGGIEPSNTTPNVMIYSDPSAGATHGYRFDGWAEDGCYYYTGAGQREDQSEGYRGNRAILQHKRDGRSLRVFEAVAGPGKRRGGKLQRYIGEFEVDDRAPVRRQDAPDTDGNPRTVLVFKLRPLNTTPQASHSVLAPEPADAPSAQFVPPEANVVSAFTVGGVAPQTAERREAALMAQLEAQLRSSGRDVGRLRITVPQSTTILLTDTYDRSGQVLYEVKANSTRQSVREAIAQLLDYQRFVDHAVACSVVLPVVPSTDLHELINLVGFDLVTPTDRGLARVDATGERHSLR